MLKNAYFLAKIGADTAENEQHFAEILPIGRRVAEEAEEAPTRRPSPRRSGPPRLKQRERTRWAGMGTGRKWTRCFRSDLRGI